MPLKPRSTFDPASIDDVYIVVSLYLDLRDEIDNLMAINSIEDCQVRRIDDNRKRDWEQSEALRRWLKEYVNGGRTDAS